MAKIDIEVIEAKFLQIVQDNLPAKLTEINTEKGDSLLTNISNSNYLNDFYQSELTPSLFIHYGISDPETISVGSDFAINWTVYFDVYLNDQNNLSTVRKRIIRYTRALYEVIQENYSVLSRYCSIPEIANVEPQDVQDIVNDTPYKTGGIKIKVSIG